MTKMHVKNLPLHITNEQLGEMAIPYGPVLAANVIFEKASGLSRGYGFVEFEQAEHARAAIRELNGREMEGRVLTFDLA